MKRILLLADVNSAHTQKWAASLASCGFEIGLFSLSSPEKSSLQSEKNIVILNGAGLDQKYFSSGAISKSLYISALPKLRKAIKEFRPDILHAHYATSYGLLGALSGFHPFIISVWGSDVYDFPRRSFLHKKILTYNFRKCDSVFSTSHIMAIETSQYTSKKIHVTPFGVDISKFNPQKVTPPVSGKLIVGTIKSLETVYGIEYLVAGFAQAFKAREEKDLHLLIVGDGSRRQFLEKQVLDLGLNGHVTFIGRVDHEKVPYYHNCMDVFIAPSLEESFGVSAVEASACGKPCVVSDAGGLKEVVVNGVTGIVIPRRSEEAIAASILALAGDEKLRQRLGQEGRQRVLAEYNWDENLKNIISLYNQVKQ